MTAVNHSVSILGDNVTCSCHAFSFTASDRDFIWRMGHAHLARPELKSPALVEFVTGRKP